MVGMQDCGSNLCSLKSKLVVYTNSSETMYEYVPYKPTSLQSPNSNYGLYLKKK